MARIARYLLLVALIPFAAAMFLFAVIQVNQRVAKRQAERLLADIRSISLHHTSFTKLGVMLSRWNGSVRYSLPCSKEHCSIWIVPRAPLPYEFYGYGYKYPVVGAIYQLLGYNFGGALANLEVRNGVVWDEGFSFGESIRTTFVNDNGKLVRSEDFIGGEISTTRFSQDPWYAGDHPDFSIHRKFPFSDYGVSVSSYASSDETNRLWRFNFSCLTRLFHPCRSPEDIIPAVMAEVSRLQQASARRETEQPHCMLDGIRMLSRDADDVAIVDVLDNRVELQRPPGYRILKVRLFQRLKGANYWPLQANREVEVTDPNALHPIDDVSNLRVGSRIILLFGQAQIVGGPVERTFLGATQCGVVPYSQEILATVRRGIEQDERVPPLDVYDPRIEYRSAFAPPVAPSIQPPPHFSKPR